MVSNKTDHIDYDRYGYMTEKDIVILNTQYTPIGKRREGGRERGRGKESERGREWERQREIDRESDRKREREWEWEKVFL